MIGAAGCLAIGAVIVFRGLLAQATEATAQGNSPARVDTEGLTAKTKFEEVNAGPLTDLNGKFKLRVTELTLAPDGYVGEHNHGAPAYAK